MPIDQQTSFPDVPSQFFELLEGWDADKFYICKQYRALGLNEDNKIVCKLAITDPRVNEDLTPLLISAKEAAATKIIIGENCLGNSLSANDKMWNRYQEMKENAQSMNLELADHLVMARRSYLSFAENAPRRNLQV